MDRRCWLQGISAGLIGAAMTRHGEAATSAAVPNVEALQKNWRALLPASAKLPSPNEPLKLSDTEWRKRLDAMQYSVLREEGTERPGSSPLNAEKRAGVFVCAGCDLPLFTSDMKFESGTGWPSFFTSIPGAFATQKDFKLILPRTEYHCVRCGGHHGHVFNDGPPPTGQRWCNNGVALKFLPKAAA
jgi:peptide-methionine (R)-S-oxide reductase